MKGIAITAWLGLVVLLGAVLPTPVDAIPAFARKYRTSCMTCHVAYPKLNMYGEVFRLNGYQVPEVEDELKQDDDISLGADSWKRVWPNGVWPGTIPGTPPLAVRGTTDFQYDDTAAISREFKPPSVTLFLSGSLQEDISAYMGFHLFEGGEIGSLGRMFIQFSSLLSNWQLPTYALNIRFGQFIPDAVPFANHRGLTLTPYATNTYYPALGSTLSAGHAHGGGGSGFLLESLQVGVEARGVIKHRVRYVIGMVNGSGAGPESNSAKDGYVRLAYKLGGIGFDGSGGNAELNNISGYVDNAITIGGFGYLGALDNPAAFGPEDLKVRRAGVDVNLTYGGLNLFGVYTFGRDQSLGTSEVHDLAFASWFAEADYNVYPWLIGVVRYETADADGIKSVKRIVPNITILPRPNIKALIETTIDPDDIGLGMVMARLDFAF